MTLVRSGFFKRHAYALLFSLGLVLMTAYVMLDTFVLPGAQTAVTVVSAASPDAGDASQTQTDSAETSDVAATQTSASSTAAAQTTDDTAGTESETESETESSEPVVTDNSYVGNGVSITIDTIRIDDTTVYVADVVLTSADNLATALAESTYGTNITQVTSEIAEESGAILAINGDFYGANKRGYVIKNGVLYRDTVRQSDDTEDLVIYADGTFAIIDETEVSAQELIDSGVVQLFAFGPALLEDGEIVVSKGEEIDKAQTSNPRTAIGIVDALHYIFVVSDGRTDESAGLSLYELAEVMQQYGCTTAYNLDGGGSSTMVFNGVVINNPTSSGTKIAQRKVSDIVCITA